MYVVECIWIAIQLNHNRIRFGLVYRPPKSGMAYFSSIEDTLNLALDTQTNNIIVTGDFNFDMLKSTNLSENIWSIQFSRYKYITERTHYTENSSSVIGIILTIAADKDNLVESGVAKPFLHQDSHYHCQVYSIFTYVGT